MSNASRLCFHRAQAERHGPLFSAELSPGASGIVVPRAHFAQALLHCASGMLRPAGGQILLDGVPPYRSPELRAKMPTLLPEEPPLPLEEPPPGKWRWSQSPVAQVGQTVSELLALRRTLTSEPEVALEDLFLLDGLLARPAASLTPRELRRVSLALALSLEAPRALLLYEPLSDLSSSEAVRVLGRLSSAVQNGAFLVIFTRQKRLADHLCERVYEMHAGKDQRYRTAPRYAVHTSATEELGVRLRRDDILCETDPLWEDLLLVSHDDERWLLEGLTRALSEEVDDFGTRARALPVREIYEAPDPRGQQQEPSK